MNEDETLLPNLTVFVPDEPEKTGLLDADGNPLVRRREPIGFDLSPRDPS